jgi:L-asparaginase II
VKAPWAENGQTLKDMDMQNDQYPVNQGAVAMAQLWRGGILESAHVGHAVICDDRGEVVEAWGNPRAVIFPRSSCKMIQALPLIETGAAEAAGLTDRQLALSCASHIGAALHTHMVEDWLKTLGLDEQDLRCGPQDPDDREEHERLIRSFEKPCQLHNNCSGKHTGFLTVNRHIGGHSEYVEADHPLQQAVKTAFEEVTGETSPGFGIDGCSAPNFATSLTGLGHAMGLFAGASEFGGARGRAMHRLTRAMADHPVLVSGEGHADTVLMRAMNGSGVVKNGADGVYVAILPELRRGIAVKIVDGAARAKEAAITALLVRVGALAADHPVVTDYLGATQRNRRGIETGVLAAAPGFPGA